MTSLSTSVAAMRRAAGLTQAELAKRLGTTQSVVARWEAGGASPTLTSIERIAHACGLEPQIVWSAREDVDRAQIALRLAWTPRQRLAYLLDMLDFEEAARRARRVTQG